MEADAVEFSAKTVSDCIQQAETQFGVPREQLDIQVLTQGRSGVFGIGAENARIRVRRVVPAPAVTAAASTSPMAATPVTTPSTGTGDGAEQARVPVREDSSPSSVATAPPAAPVGDLPEAATVVLRHLLDGMGFDAEITVRSTENPVMLAISGDNLGVLIGRRGDNLSALQFMVNLILSKSRRQWPRVVIDVENYRARREESLRALAERIAYRVERNGRPFTLEAMPASDRRIIHLVLRDREGIETYSIGEGVARRVVVAPKREEREYGT